eukprot:c5290_g1_i3.p1 GENE.c5290_g1_i3~~c5290_g1_i3.p1  ORF type:complete len:357 (-),score=56.31 c5290_g1_i3:120-1151(-)
MDMTQEEKEKKVSEFQEITSADTETARRYLEQQKWNSENAVSAFMDQPQPSANPIDSILSKAEPQSQPVEDRGRGILEKTPEAKSIKICFYSDGFTVESSQPAVRKRKVGMATLESIGGEDVVELRSYEDNKELLEDLAKSRVPKEFQSRDPATGQPVPVNVSLTDQRTIPCPRLKTRPREQKPYQGTGHTLGGQAQSAPRPNEQPNPNSWVQYIRSWVWWGASGVLGVFLNFLTLTGLDSRLRITSLTSTKPSADPTKPKISLRIRTQDGRVFTATLNLTHTVGDLHRWLQSEISESTASPTQPKFDLMDMSAFPPRCLSQLDQTLEQAGLSGAQLRIRFLE